MDEVSDKTADLRRAVYALLLVVACASITGRILTLDSARTPRQQSTPFQSANDRSRWSTIVALVDHGTFELDDVIFDEQGRRRSAWYSIDLVKHRGADGREHYYSSKPTLLTVLLAGEYWVVKLVLGLSLAENPLYVGRVMLILTNVLAFGVYLLVLAQLVERYGRTDWGRIFVMTCAAFGTFITTFSVTLNNHTLAAVTALLAIQQALYLWDKPRGQWWRYVVCGLFAALTAANELPALALLALLGVALAWKSPLKTLLGFAPPALLVAAAALGTNYWAHGTWKTPYAHRHDGPVIATLDANEELLAALNQGQLPPAIRDALSAKPNSAPSATTQVEPRTPNKRWVLWDEAQQLRLAVVASPEARQLQIRAWDNWYDYEGTYWNDEHKTGVDRGEPSRWVYALHCLVGHHGIFSLTPIWLFTLCGLWFAWREPERGLRPLAVLVAVLTLVVLAFYIVQRPEVDRNYGGVSAGLRWMFWFAPLWLVVMLPAADQVAPRKFWRAFALALLAISVLSAHYASLNPWSPPWLFEYWSYLGWIKY
jgi:hypothetical protein